MCPFFYCAVRLFGGIVAVIFYTSPAGAAWLSGYRDAVVFITAEQVDPDGTRHVKDSGTGFFVSEEGYIITAAHVLSETGNAQSPLTYYAAIKSRWEHQYKIEVIKRDVELDIGLARLPDVLAQPKVVKLRSLERRDLDGKVYILGFPGSSDLDSGEGQLSSEFGLKGNWQTTLPMRFGSSGGPVFDAAGYVVGLAVGGTAAGVNFVIPAQRFKWLLNLIDVPVLKVDTHGASAAVAPPLAVPSKPPGPSCLDEKADLTIEEIQCQCFSICPVSTRLPIARSDLRLPSTREESEERRFDTYDGRDIDGHDLREPLRGVELQGCVDTCKEDESCKAFSYDRWNRMCFLKNSIPRTFRVEPSSVVAVPARSDIKLSTRPIEMEKFNDALFLDESFKALTNMSRDLCAAACERESRCQVFSFLRQNKICRLIEYPSEYFRKYLPDKRTPNPKYVVEADSGIKRQKPEYRWGG